MPKSYLEVNGIYNPALRFAFTNITSELFESAWDGIPYLVQAHETVELPHYLAVKFTNELVDKIMQGEAKMDEIKHGGDYYRSPKGAMAGIPAMRKPWEDKILKELGEVDTHQLKVIRQELKQQLVIDHEGNKPLEPMPEKVEAFAQINSQVETPKAKKPAGVKRVTLA